MDLEGIMPLLSLVTTMMIGLITQIYRMRKQIGVAKDDPLQYALKAVVDTFTFQDESLYLMSLLSKLIKNLLQYITLLAGNGEDVLIAEIKAITNSLAQDIARLESSKVSKLTDNQRQILDEVKSLLAKRR
jgi:adenylate cyclase